MTDDIKAALEAIKKAGYGQVVIKIQDHKIVYVERTEGKQIKNS